MKLAILASLLSLSAAPALAVSFQERFPTRKCGTNHFNATTEAKNQRVIQAYAQQSVKALATRNVPVYWHTITSGSSGSISSSQINSQINVLNQDYSGSGYSFYLAGTDSTSNANWFTRMDDGNYYEYQMKTSLRKGGANALNIYTVNFENGLLGFATFPMDYNSTQWQDGVVIQYNSLPGGSLSPYNLGRTATHEVGHWLGLYHVFQGPLRGRLRTTRTRYTYLLQCLTRFPSHFLTGGCSGRGDYVHDTPPQSTATYGCPSGQDSCSGGGVDSIHNYMDYSDDSCMNQFTRGQHSRMHALTATYRSL
ncbi:hypothetical protein V8E36_006471 [Tilletia maclaganii]